MASDVDQEALFKLMVRLGYTPDLRPVDSMDWDYRAPSSQSIGRVTTLPWLLGMGASPTSGAQRRREGEIAKSPMSYPDTDQTMNPRFWNALASSRPAWDKWDK